MPLSRFCEILVLSFLVDAFAGGAEGFRLRDGVDDDSALSFACSFFQFDESSAIVSARFQF